MLKLPSCISQGSNTASLQRDKSAALDPENASHEHCSLEEKLKHTAEQHGNTWRSLVVFGHLNTHQKLPFKEKIKRNVTLLDFLVLGLLARTTFRAFC